MPNCPHCKRTFKNLSNHLAQSLCQNVVTRSAVARSQSTSALSHGLQKSISLNLPKDTDPCLPSSKKARTMDTGAHRRTEDDSDSISIQTPNSFMIHVLDSVMQPPCDMETNSNMCSSNKNSANASEDNSTACGIAMLDESIAAMSAPNVQGIDAILSNFSVHEAKSNDTIITTREDRLLIRLSSLCTEANVPLYLLDDIVEIFREEAIRGLTLDSCVMNKRRSFLNRICHRFPSPVAQSFNIGLEGNLPMNYNYRREHRDCVSMVFYDFVEQLNDS